MPDLRPLLAHATRFFARLSAFDLECPHCGAVHVVRYRGRRKQRLRPVSPATRRAKHQADINWDPWTSRFTCRECQRQFVLGLVAWPIAANPAVASTPPRDQVPNPRQLGYLRKDGGGWWLPDDLAQRYATPHTTNLALVEERPENADDEE